MSKALVVFYSRKGQNYLNGTIKHLAKGNTAVVAEMIQERTGADIFEVDTVKPYSEDYTTCTEEAKAELREQARPAIKGYVDSLDAYDTLFVGYPNWWGTMPRAMCTFLEHYDLAGKKILPFCTNEGSGMGSSEQELRSICPGAEVGKGLAIHGAEAGEAAGKVEAWLKSVL